MPSVAGYLRTVDARIIASLLAYQEANSIAGNLCEIGVHHGRLFFMLALARQAGERALAVDLFEDDAINYPSHWHRGRDHALVENARRLNIPLQNEEIFKTSSLVINDRDILERAGGPIRLFSVDGGHNYQCVENDLKLATRTISDRGIIVVDDFFNRDWPEVTFATLDFIRGTAEVVPFLLSSGKLFLTTAAMASAYQDAARKANRDMESNVVGFLDHHVYFMRFGYYRRILDLVGDIAKRYAGRVKARVVNSSVK